MNSPNKPRPDDPLVRAVADTLAAIERNYDREGSGPGSRFEGQLLEDAQALMAVRLVREAAAQRRWNEEARGEFRHRYTAIPDTGQIELHCSRCQSEFSDGKWLIGYHPSLDVVVKQARAHDRKFHDPEAVRVRRPAGQGAVKATGPNPVIRTDTQESPDAREAAPSGSTVITCALCGAVCNVTGGVAACPSSPYHHIHSGDGTVEGCSGCFTEPPAHRKEWWEW